MKTKKLFKLLIACLLLIVQMGCENNLSEIPVEEEKSLQETQLVTKPDLMRGTVEDFPNLSELLKNEVEDKKAFLQKSVDSGLYDFEVIQNAVSQISWEEDFHYTFPLVRQDENEANYENLVIANRAGFEPKAYFVQYFPDETYWENLANDPNTPFQGSAQIVPFDISAIPLSSSSSSCTRTITVVKCRYVGHNPIPGEDPDTAGPGCTETYTETVTIAADCSASGGTIINLDGLGGGGGTSDESSDNTLPEPPSIEDSSIFLDPMIQGRRFAIKLNLSSFSDAWDWVFDSDNTLQMLQLLSFVEQNNDSEEAKSIAKDVINLTIDIEEFDTFLRQEQFDPLNSPWLERAREIADKIFERLENAPEAIKERLVEAIDNSFVFALNKTALQLNPNANTNSESTKQNQFENNGRNGVGILLYEFANGLGEDIREFPFDFDMTQQMLAGNVPRDIKNDFFTRLSREGLTFEQFVSNDRTIPGGYSFSPDHTTIEDSFNKHKNANWVQFFIGGASAKYSPNNQEGWITVELSNGTSRSSLMARLADDYPRDGSGNNRPLSTIKQIFKFRLKVR